MDPIIDLNDYPQEQLQADESQIKTQLLEKARSFGPFVTIFIQSLWTDGVVRIADDAGRLIRLAAHYDPQRVEAACRRALFYRKLNYTTVNHILFEGLDSLPLNPYADVDGQLTLFPMNNF